MVPAGCPALCRLRIRDCQHLSVIAGLWQHHQHFFSGGQRADEGLSHWLGLSALLWSPSFLAILVLHCFSSSFMEQQYVKHAVVMQGFAAYAAAKFGLTGWSLSAFEVLYDPGVLLVIECYAIGFHIVMHFTPLKWSWQGEKVTSYIEPIPQELRDYGIRVSAIFPGYVATEMTEEWVPSRHPPDICMVSIGAMPCSWS